MIYVHAFTAFLLQASSIKLWVDVATIFLSQIFLAVLFDDYVYNLNSFRGGSGQLIAQLHSICQPFLSICIHFHKPLFSWMWSILKLPSRLNTSFQLFKRTCFCFSKSQTTNRYTNQPTSRVQFPSLFHFCINKLLHTIIILDYIMLTGLILTNMQISHQYKLSTQSQSRKVTHWVTLYW